MAFPTNIGSGRIIGQFIAAVMDDDDSDQEPNYVAAEGTILLTPSIPYFPNVNATGGPVTITPAPVAVILDTDGIVSTPTKGDPSVIAYPGVRVFATNDPDASVQNWTWLVSYNLSAGGTRLNLQSHSIAVLEGATVDLSTVIKVPSSPGVGIPQYEAAVFRAEAAAVAAAEAAANSTGGTGTVGPEGPAGPIGPQGPAGTDGLDGAIGPQGPAGDTGPAGPIGATGTIGETGPAGTPGIDGAMGPIGPEGPQGIAGVKGDTGLTGTPGAKGDTGPQGPIGADGPQGIQGATGLTGPKGDTGAIGPAGADSTVPGPIGPKGDTGAPGTSTYADLPVGTTLTVPSTSARPTDRTDIVVQFAGGTTRPTAALVGDIHLVDMG